MSENNSDHDYDQQPIKRQRCELLPSSAETSSLPRDQVLHYRHLLLSVFQFLGHPGIGNLFRVNRLFRQLAGHACLWQTLNLDQWIPRWSRPMSKDEKQQGLACIWKMFRRHSPALRRTIVTLGQGDLTEVNGKIFGYLAWEYGLWDEKCFQATESKVDLCLKLDWTNLSGASYSVSRGLEIDMMVLLIKLFGQHKQGENINVVLAKDWLQACPGFFLHSIDFVKRKEQCFAVNGIPIQQCRHGFMVHLLDATQPDQAPRCLRCWLPELDDEFECSQGHFEFVMQCCPKGRKGWIRIDEGDGLVQDRLHTEPILCTDCSKRFLSNWHDV